MKILLVDDSKSARYALRLQLQRHGVEVETDEAAESALERVRNTPPDAIFMDHTMPGMNGFEALEILKATLSTKHIPVVMCTSNEDPQFIAQAKKKGALDILSKSTAPEKLANLLVRLQQAIDGAEPGFPPVAEALMPGRAIPGTTSHPRTDTPEDVTTEKRLEERIRALIEPQMDELSEQLASKLIERTDESVVSRMSQEAERLQKHFIKAQSEQAQLTTTRLINEVLPLVVQQQLEQEKQNIAQMVQSLIDTSLDALVDEPGFRRRMLDSVDVSATVGTEEMIRRQAQEIAETLAMEHDSELTERLTQSSVPSNAPMYLLAAGAALVGIGSAAIVFFQLS